MHLKFQSITPAVPGDSVIAPAPRDTLKVPLVMEQKPPQLCRLELDQLSSIDIIDDALRLMSDIL